MRTPSPPSVLAAWDPGLGCAGGRRGTRPGLAFSLALALAVAAPPAGAGIGGGGSGEITFVTSSAETEVGANFPREQVEQFDLDLYEHELERITPGDEGEEDSREFAAQTSRITHSTSSLSVTSRGDAELDAQPGVGHGFTTFSLSFDADGPVNVTFSAQVSVDAPGNGASSDATVSFGCGCDPEEDEEECSVEDVDLEVEDAPGVPRTASGSTSGRASGGCTLFALALTSLGEDQKTAKASWDVTLTVSSGTAPEQGTTFRWVGPAQGAFADESNWEDENGAEGVPGFRSFEDADTAIVQGETAVDLDLAGGGLSRRGARGVGGRQTGRLAVISTQILRPLNGTLLLDRLDPSIGGRSLEVSGARLLLDQGAVRARHVLVGTESGAELEVVGPGGGFETLGRFGVGGDAEGNVTLRDGAQVTSAETVLGELNAGGSATVQGSGTLWRTGNFALGLADDAGLTIEGGARVESESAYVDCQIATGPNVPGCTGLAGDERARATVTGAGSTWAVADELEIAARGKVVVDAGGRLEVLRLQVGTTPQSCTGQGCLEPLRGTLEVVDGLVQAVALGVGSEGAGELRIGPAGRVQAIAVALVGSELSSGKVRVTGPSGEGQLQAPLSIGTGVGARGDVVLEQGARIDALGGLVGGVPGSDGVLEVRGDAANESLVRVTQGTTLQVGFFTDEPLPEDEVFADTGLVLLANGRIALEDADLEIHPLGRVDGSGVVEGTGIDDVVSNDGSMGCGVAVQAGYIQGPNGVLECPQAAPPAAPQLNPFAATRFARALRAKKPAPPPPPPPGPFVVTGDATLDGTLILRFMNGYAPAQGDAFELLRVSGNVTGAFANVLVRGLAPGADFAQDFVDGKLTLTSLTDATPLPVVSVKAKPKLREKKKKGLKIKLTRRGDLSQPLSVRYVVRGTAENGLDYEELPGVVEIPARKKSAKLALRAFPDGVDEGPETFSLEVVPGDGYQTSLFSKVEVAIQDEKPKKKKRR